MARLKTLAGEIKDGHLAALNNLGRSIESLIEAGKCKALVGQRLLEVKSLLPHGDWIPWLERTYQQESEDQRLSVRCAQYYMSFSRSWPQLAPELERIAKTHTLSFLDRLRLIRGLLMRAAFRAAIPETAEAADPERLALTELDRWADRSGGSLQQWLGKIRLSSLDLDAKRALRAKLEPIHRLYEELGA